MIADDTPMSTDKSMESVGVNVSMIPALGTTALFGFASSAVIGVPSAIIGVPRGNQ
jgi:hypothetical protein